MFNSQNLSQDFPARIAQSVKQARKTKTFADYLTYPELQALNLKLARREYVQAVRHMRQAEYATLDGNWSEVLAG